ncbi:MAG: response regulator [Nitrospirae bacterium]|nr:response regulator [Nitrospirota bacterium]
MIDDQRGPRDALKAILRPFFTIQTADSASAALDILNSQQIDLVTLDQHLPDRQGLDLLQEITHHHADVEIIIITGHGSVTDAMEGMRHGAAGYLLKPFNVSELLALVKQTIGKKQRLDFLRSFLKTSPGLWESDIACAQEWQAVLAGYQEVGIPEPGQAAHAKEGQDLLPLFSDLLESTDRQLIKHSTRVSSYATLLGRRINLPPPEQQSLALGAFLHDIGKIRPQPHYATDEESAVIKKMFGSRQHQEQGAKLMLPLGLPAEVGQIIAYHHERWDGAGYPYGLQEEGIPQLVRIVCLAQAFDYLTTDHPDHKPLSIDDACRQIRSQAGTRFDPQLTALFVEAIQASQGTLPAMAMATAPTDRLMASLT